MFYMQTKANFNIFSSNGHIIVWGRKNEELNGSVVVFACMSASGLGNLIFIDGIMNHSLYLNILRRNLILSAQNMGIGNNFIFYHDNNPKHTALQHSPVVSL